MHCFLLLFLALRPPFLCRGKCWAVKSLSVPLKHCADLGQTLKSESGQAHALSSLLRKELFCTTRSLGNPRKHPHLQRFSTQRLLFLKCKMCISKRRAKNQVLKKAGLPQATWTPVLPDSSKNCEPVATALRGPQNLVSESCDGSLCFKSPYKKEYLKLLIYSRKLRRS